MAGDDDEQARCGAEAPVPEFSVVFRFRAYSRRHETEPESISPQDVLGHEVAGHAGFYVMVQCSVSQLCNELQKLESWSAADP